MVESFKLTTISRTKSRVLFGNTSTNSKRTYTKYLLQAEYKKCLEKPSVFG